MRKNIYFIVLTQPNSSELWNINTIMISYQFSYVYWSSQANIYWLPVLIKEKKKQRERFPKVQKNCPCGAESHLSLSCCLVKSSSDQALS